MIEMIPTNMAQAQANQRKEFLSQRHEKRLNERFSLALTICESLALFFVSSWCVNLIRVSLHDDTLH